MSPTDTPPGESFRSSAELQDTHADLVKQVGTDVLSNANLSRIRRFVARAVATGKLLDAKEDRAAAQGLVNFWAARLSSASRAARDEKTRTVATLPLDDVLLADFDPTTIGDAAAAAERWVAALPESDREAARRVVLRLVRLKGEPPTFEPVPAVRATLHDLDPSPERVDRLVASLHQVGALRVLRAPAGDPPGGDRISLRDPELMTAWPALAGWLAERKRFRQRAITWARGSVAGPPLTASWFRRTRRRIGVWLTYRLARFGQRMDTILAGVRRRLGLASVSDEMLTADEIEEARTYHDRNEEERRYIDQSRYWEEQRNRRNRVLLGVFVVVTVFALIAAYYYHRYDQTESDFNKTKADFAEWKEHQAEAELTQERHAREEADANAERTRQALAAAQAQRDQVLAERDELKQLLGTFLDKNKRESALSDPKKIQEYQARLKGLEAQQGTLDALGLLRDPNQPLRPGGRVWVRPPKGVAFAASVCCILRTPDNRRLALMAGVPQAGLADARLFRTEDLSRPVGRVVSVNELPGGSASTSVKQQPPTDTMVVFAVLEPSVQADNMLIGRNRPLRGIVGSAAPNTPITLFGSGSGVNSGHVLQTTPDGRVYYSRVSAPGDSGGAVVTDHDELLAAHEGAAADGSFGRLVNPILTKHNLRLDRGPVGG